MVEYPAPIDQAFTALAHPTRRAIVTLLAQHGETRVTELAAPFDVSLNAVSKHLKVLERAGVVRRRVEGREHWCRFEPDALDPALDWLDRQRRFWTESLDLLEDYLKTRRRKPKEESE